MTTASSTPRHTVRHTALRTGLTPHILRAWERRYRVVSPARTDGGQRLYSDQDLERLQLLRRLTAQGHSIGRLAKTPLAELETMSRNEVSVEVKEQTIGSRPEDFRSAALNAARRLDASELQGVLERAAVTLGVPGFLNEVAGPVLEEIGDAWSAGRLSVAHEHLASTVFRRVLAWIIGLFDPSGNAPRMVVATPPGQAHEFGALIASAMAAAEGWDVTYLGPDLPVSDILSAAQQVEANAVALSVVYPVEDPALFPEIERLRRATEHRAALLIGGAAASARRDEFTALGAEVVDSLAQFRTALQRLQDHR